MRKYDSGRIKSSTIPPIPQASPTLAPTSSQPCSPRPRIRDMMLDFLLLLLGAGVLVAVMALVVLVEVTLVFLLLLR